ncbi:MAG: 3-deoxy-D-manno-oct-2-ulosonic acid (Kdo) hydroxylase, partial [Acidobacteriaceae bacterium]|nr:3-deoxy-D-manno-oct-2-ulosonic acid (Kdo) hydroxylase [Acidobacteriaceae bacterium]
MALVTITAADSATPEQKREWCERLEEGSILYFPQSPIPLSA